MVWLVQIYASRIYNATETRGGAVPRCKRFGRFQKPENWFQKPVEPENWLGGAFACYLLIKETIGPPPRNDPHRNHMAYARSVWDCSLAPLFVGSRKGAGGAAASQQFRLALALNCALDEKGRCARPSCVRKIGRNHFREHVLKNSLDSITGMGFLSSFIGPYYSHIDSSMPPPLLFGCDARLPALPRLHVRSIPGRSIDLLW